MRMIFIATAVALAASSVHAAPYVAIDATRQFVIFVDDGSVVRSGDAVALDLVAVQAEARAVVMSLRIDCATRTWEPTGNRYVEADGSIGPLQSAKAAPRPAAPGTFASTALKRACSGAPATPDKWSAPTLSQAIVQGKAAIKAMATQP